VNSLIVTLSTIILRLLHSPLSLPVHHHLYRPQLLHPFLLSGDELIHKKVFSNHYALLINDVIELAFFLLDDVFLVLLLIIIVIVLLVIEVLLWLLLLAFDVTLVVQLIQDVLDLPLELLVTLLHQILQDLRHAKLFGLLSQLLTRENGV